VARRAAVALDFYTHRVIAVDESGAVDTVAEVPGQPSGLAGCRTAGLLCVHAGRECCARRPTARWWRHVDLAGWPPDLNDMLWTTPAGLLGNSGRLMAGARCARPTWCASTRTASPRWPPTAGVPQPGWRCWTGATLVVAESFGNRLAGYTVGADGRVEVATGPASGRRTSDDLGELLPGLTVGAGTASAPPRTGRLWWPTRSTNRAIRVAEGRDPGSPPDRQSSLLRPGELGGTPI